MAIWDFRHDAGKGVLALSGTWLIRSAEAPEVHRLRRERMAIAADTGYGHALADTFRRKGHDVSFGCSQHAPATTVKLISYNKYSSTSAMARPAALRVHFLLWHEQQTGEFERATRTQITSPSLRACSTTCGRISQSQTLRFGLFEYLLNDRVILLGD